jgi:chromosomal replication initiation ATPase DnaA
VFEGRDHTTVMNAVEKIEERMQMDPQMLREVRSLEKELDFV